MFGKIKEKINQLVRPAVMDPAQFDDPVAETTEWTPLKRGGNNLTTNKHKAAAPHRMVFGPTVGAVLFCGVLAGTGLTLLVIGVRLAFAGESSGFERFLLPSIGMVFFLIGAGLLCSLTTPIVFDASQELYYKGRRSPDETIGPVDPEAKKNVVPFGRIYALQIIREYCSGSKGGGYYSYELNLVLDDGSRVNVVDHGNQTKLRDDAFTLAGFLGKPIWDVT